MSPDIVLRIYVAELRRRAISFGRPGALALAAEEYRQEQPNLADLITRAQQHLQTQLEVQVILGGDDRVDFEGAFQPPDVIWWDDARCSAWAAFESHTRRSLAKAGLSASVVDEQLQRYRARSTSLVLRMGMPTANATDRETFFSGLVLGNVQSGKTTDFSAVLAQARCAGWSVVVVLSGVTENLRTQTQTRLEAVLGVDGDWEWLTSEARDFVDPGVQPLRNLVANGPSLIAVIKKNPCRLGLLKKWLQEANIGPLNGLLVIDDEADQASPDVGTRSRQSRINALIRELLTLDVFRRAAYVAYTATPFANVLAEVSPTSLYPRDLIRVLPTGPGYQGAEHFFGRERIDDEDEGVLPSNQVHTVSEAEAAEARLGLSTGGLDAAPALLRALEWFILATAVRLARRASSADPTPLHSSMLVHTSMLAARQNEVGAAVRCWLEGVRAAWRPDGDLAADLRGAWEGEAAGADAWDEVLPFVEKAIQESSVIVDNYQSGDRLIYPADDDCFAIVVGGNKLSRGLTLEGLVSSYFVRGGKLYDTLLQMGRWYGYRPGYEDLPRVWTTEELQRYLTHLAGVEAEIRRSIDKDLAAATPLQVGVAIRTHEEMDATRRSALRFARPLNDSLAGQRPQTVVFRANDAEWLGRNIDAASALVRAAGGAEAAARVRGRQVFRGVPVSAILQFLGDYQMHDSATRVTNARIIEYISAEVAEGRCAQWSVVVMGSPDIRPRGPDLGAGPTSLVVRSRLRGTPDDAANIGSLVSVMDRVADLDVVRADLERDQIDPGSDTQITLFREEQLGTDSPLLVLYPIDAVSPPKDGNSDNRVDLGAVGVVIGVAFFFPDSTDGVDAAVEYIGPRLPDLEALEEQDDIDAADLADETTLETP